MTGRHGSFLLIALLLAGCSGDAPQAGAVDSAAAARATTPEIVDSTMALVAPAAAVALALKEQPAKADSILAAAGLSIEQFEALMYRIAADTAARRFYTSLTGP
jgi:PBP1b-binding outer membrane lipoprotein LpoB